MREDLDACYRALQARDARFDGEFYVAVSTTGIYCRPVCTARTPRRDRCKFYATAAEAEKAGYRACFRCRPELAPGASSVDALPNLVAEAVAQIEAGFLDEHSADELAEELGVSARHLRRAMEQQLGVSPLELAQTRRMAMAKRLLHDTQLSITEVALASGFGSLRRFNTAFAHRFGRPPSQVRRRLPGGSAPTTLALRLDTRPPLDWDALLAFFATRAIPGVEEIVAGEYRRVLTVGGSSGVVRVRRDGAHAALWAELSPALGLRLAQVVPLLRRLFDLDAQPALIQECLQRDPLLAPLLARRPGLRVPGAVAAFEIVCRAVLGQQVSVRAASTLAGRLVAAFGAPLSEDERGALPAGSSLASHFPLPARMAAASVAELAAIGLPSARARTLQLVAAAFATGALADYAAPQARPRALDPGGFLAALSAIPGIGAWTAQYVAMRSLADPDAFPASDLGVRKALGGLPPKAAIARAAAWQPWRAYAVMHLWGSLAPTPTSTPAPALTPTPTPGPRRKPAPKPTPTPALRLKPA